MELKRETTGHVWGFVPGFAFSLMALALLTATSGSPLLCQATPATWSVSQEPLVRIGAAASADDYLFQSIAGVVRLPGDRIAVADNGFLTIRVYDHGGRYLYRMGGRGAGPGEFYSIDGLWLTDDGELGVWDSTVRRITRFTQDGTVVESKRIVTKGGVGYLQVFFGAMASGEVLLAALASGPAERGEAHAGVYLLRRYSLSGKLRGSVGHVEGMWRYEWRDGSNTPVPFTPVPWVATWHDTIYVAAGYGSDIEVRNRYGAVVRTLPVPGGRPATREDWAEMERVLRTRAKDLPNGAFYVNRLKLGELPADTRLPSVAGLLLDNSGLVWTRAFEPARDALWLKGRSRPPAPGGEWQVLDPTDGRVMARVQMPSSLVPIVIGKDEIIGEDVDSLGVERVAIHALRRGRGRL